ncbi:MAG: hypothetical protein FWE29_06270 [Defluviitaleaceae bacterium]|nr:hypothetical protein [Defluviitaleaceae bacterium]
MKNDKGRLSNLNPVENYAPPKLPTLNDAQNDTALLKKLPLRWKNSAKVIACIGIIGVGSVTLSGCSSLWSEQPGIAVFDTIPHHGGSGPAPIYIVHLTEQEAFGIIQAQLESAGLNFNAAPPDYTVELGGQNISLELFDEDKGVAIAHIREENLRFPENGWRYVESVAEEFAKKANDISIGVFYNPAKDDWMNNVEAEAATRQNLIDQAQKFITSLQDEGILERQIYDDFIHFGGAGGAPFYVVHLTEQEAFGIIQAQLESAGLNFNAAPPDYTVELGGQNISLELFDEDKGVAIAHIREESLGFLGNGRMSAELAAEEFSQQANDISVGVFYNPAKDGWMSDVEAEAETRQNLIDQAQKFIAFLRDEGILE